MANLTYLTQEAFERLKAELAEMKSTGRSEVAKAIAEAREKGDLSENAEYDAAREAQGLLEMRISDLTKSLATCRIIDAKDLDTDKVLILSLVKVKNLKNSQTVTYKLVSQQEANLKENKISVNSPIGKGLLGKTVGEKVEITVPAGALEYEILDISH